jgi:hypothetical protein
LFATQEAFSQITQGKAEPKPGKRPARFNINPFGHILIILANVCGGDSRQKIRSEFTLRPFHVSILSKTIFPGSALVLVEIASVPRRPPRRKIVSDHNV